MVYVRVNLVFSFLFLFFVAFAVRVSGADDIGQFWRFVKADFSYYPWVMMWVFVSPFLLGIFSFSLFWCTWFVSHIVLNRLLAILVLFGVVLSVLSAFAMKGVSFIAFAVVPLAFAYVASRKLAGMDFGADADDLARNG